MAPLTGPFFMSSGGPDLSGSLAVSVNGLYCKKGIRQELVPLQHHQRSIGQTLSDRLMKKTTTTNFQMDEHRSINFQYGLIVATDSSDQIVSIYAGTENINDAVAELLPTCDRSTQERFLQILTDHIRKVDSVKA